MSRSLKFLFFSKQLKSLQKLCSCFFKRMEELSDTEEKIFAPPSCVKGMLKLDRSAFTKEVVVPAVLVPLQSMNLFRKKFKRHVLSRRPGRLLDADEINSENGKLKFVTMKPGFSFKDSDMTELVMSMKIEPRVYNKKMELTYLSYKHNEILSAILPESIIATSGYEAVGHIAHVNLMEDQLPYKNLIGQVILDKHGSLRTVVNKSSIIDNTYRNFRMEVIAGENDFVTKVVEFGRTYEFDFSKVFWNSKLQTEHSRLFEAIPKDSVVFDVFAGVGPFSIPLAKKGCKVYSNDLNEESYKWLLHNAKLNKVKLEAFNLDGRHFLITHFGNYIRKNPSSNENIYVIMNLPALAVEFLDSFQGILANCEIGASSTKRDCVGGNLPRIRVFCYIFSSDEDMKGDVRARAAQSLGHSLPEDHEIREVRKVAPGKYMLLLSFDLPKDVLLETNNKVVEDVQEEPEKKKLKVS